MIRPSRPQTGHAWTSVCLLLFIATSTLVVPVAESSSTALVVGFLDPEGWKDFESVEMGRGLDLAVSELAEAGVEIRLVTETVRGDPVGESRAYERLVDAGADVIIIGPHTLSSTALVDLAVRHRTVTLSIWPETLSEGGTDAADGWFYPLAGPAQLEAEALAILGLDLTGQTEGLQVAVYHQEATRFNALHDALQDVLRDRAGGIIWTESSPGGWDAYYHEEWNMMQSQEADAYIVLADAETSASFHYDVQDSGGSRGVPLIFGGEALDDVFVQKQGTFTDDTWVAQGAYGVHWQGGVEAWFDEVYRGVYDEDMNAAAGTAYEAVSIAASAAYLGGAATSATIREHVVDVTNPAGVRADRALEAAAHTAGQNDVDLTGAAPGLDLDERGVRIGLDYLLWTVDADGLFQWYGYAATDTGAEIADGTYAAGGTEPCPGCGGNQSGPVDPAGVLDGKVEAPAGREITVSLFSDGPEGRAFMTSQPAGADGSFSFSGLADGDYLVVAVTDKGESAQTPVRLEGGAQSGGPATVTIEGGTGSGVEPGSQGPDPACDPALVAKTLPSIDEDEIEALECQYLGELTGGVRASATFTDRAHHVRSVSFIPDRDAPGAVMAVAYWGEEGPDDAPKPKEAAKDFFSVTLLDATGRFVKGADVQVAFDVDDEWFAKVSGGDGSARLKTLTKVGQVFWDTVHASPEDGHWVAETGTFGLFATSVAACPPLRCAMGGMAIPLIIGVPLTALGLGAGGALFVRRRRAAARAAAPVAAIDPVARTESLRAAMVPTDDTILSGPFQAEGVTVRAGSKTIVEDITFTFNQGEIVGLLGTSGCGKSTTLKAVVGENRYEGQVSVFGLDPRKERDRLKRLVGYVPQDTQLYPEMTVRENLRFFGTQYKVSASLLADRMAHILDILDLREAAERPVRVLSGGQQRRAAIGATLVFAPRMLILDEPTSGLDPVTRRGLWRFLRLINHELDISIIVTTHYLDEAEHADKLVIMHKGRLVGKGEPEKMKKAMPGGGRMLLIELETSAEILGDRLEKALDPLYNDEVIDDHGAAGYMLRIFARDPHLKTAAVIATLNEAEIEYVAIDVEEVSLEDVFVGRTGDKFE